MKMRFGLQELDWKYAGALLARCDADDQAEFFKAFVRECKTWGTHFQVEMQLAGINRLLTEDEKDVLGMIPYKDPLE